MLVPLSVITPDPDFTNPPVPLITPEKRVLLLSAPASSLPAPSATLPAPDSDPTVWLKPLRSSAAGAATWTAPLPNAFTAPARSTPSLTSVPPVCVLVPARVKVPVPFFEKSPVPVRPVFSVAVDLPAVSITPPPAPIVNVRLLTTVLPFVTPSVPVLVASPSVTAPAAAPSAPSAPITTVLLPFTAVPLYVLPALVSVKVPPPLTFRLPAWPVMPFSVAVCPPDTLTGAAPPRLAFC